MNLQPTVPPKVLKEGHRRCEQIRCTFFQQGFCQSCEKGHNCNARPYEINPSCSACLACEGDEGFLRFGDDSLMQDVGVPQMEGDVVIIMNSKPSKGHLEQEKRMEKEIESIQ